MREKEPEFIVQLRSNKKNERDGCERSGKNEYEMFTLGPWTPEERDKIKSNCHKQYRSISIGEGEETRIECFFEINKKKIIELMNILLFPRLSKYQGLWTHDILNGTASWESDINIYKHHVKKAVDEIYTFNITKLYLDGSIKENFLEKESLIKECQFDKFLSLMQVPVYAKDIQPNIPELLSSIEAHILREAQQDNTINSVIKLHSTIEDNRRLGRWHLVGNEYEMFTLGFLTPEERNRFKDVCYWTWTDMGTSKKTNIVNVYKIDKKSIITALDSILYGRLYKYRGYSVDDILNGNKSSDILKKAKNQIDEDVEKIYTYNINFLKEYEILKENFGEEQSYCYERQFDNYLSLMQVLVFSKNIQIDMLKLLNSIQAYFPDDTRWDNTGDR